ELDGRHHAVRAAATRGLPEVGHAPVLPHLDAVGREGQARAVPEQTLPSRVVVRGAPPQRPWRGSRSGRRPAPTSTRRGHLLVPRGPPSPVRGIGRLAPEATSTRGSPSAAASGTRPLWEVGPPPCPGDLPAVEVAPAGRARTHLTRG